MNLLAITVLGQDRPGIIADVTHALAELGGNLEDSSMTLLRGHFAMTLVVRTDADEQQVSQALGPAFAGDGLAHFVRALPHEAASPPAGRSYLLSVHGADRVGIVSAVTGVVAAHGGNVTDLTTRLAGALYVLLAEVELPDTADLGALEHTLAETAAALGVDASLRPSESDLL